MLNFNMENKGRILIADDEEGQRCLVSEATKMFFPGYELEVFKEGTSLKERLEGLVGKETEIKLVLTDNQMPGYEGSKLIREYSEKINPPMILIYGGKLGIGEQALKDCAYGFIQKPFRLQEFNELVERALSFKK